MVLKKRLQLALLLLRLSVFLVIAMWTLDKFVNTEHALAVFDKFYSLSGVAHELMYVIAGLECLLLLGFVLGWAKTWTYGAVLVLHGASTFSSFAQYLTPFEGSHLLFFAAWPMLAACVTLFLLRDEDRLLSI